MYIIREVNGRNKKGRHILCCLIDGKKGFVGLIVERTKYEVLKES